MLGKNCPVATPTQEDSGMSFTEQSGTPPPDQNPVQPDPSAEIHPCSESPQKSSALSEKMDGEIPSGEDSDSDSDPESDSESCSILTHEVSLTLDWWFLQRKLHLRIYRIIPLQRRLLHGNQIQMHL